MKLSSFIFIISKSLAFSYQNFNSYNKYNHGDILALDTTRSRPTAANYLHARTTINLHIYYFRLTRAIAAEFCRQIPPFSCAAREACDSHPCQREQANTGRHELRDEEAEMRNVIEQHVNVQYRNN
ncbi:Hypothetical_protein [Hexamita inflata]|uniref:Hypothetical_protein n=1 Tax=Hexamita inflata TaxID=28002 RepID=A0ABP1GDZ0_9EUKA